MPGDSSADFFDEFGQALTFYDLHRSNGGVGTGRKELYERNLPAFITTCSRNSERKGVERKDMKIDINKDFETAYQQSIWKGLNLKQSDYGRLLFADGRRDYGCPLVFLNVPPQGDIYIENMAALPSRVLGLYKYRGMSIPMLCKEWKYLQKTKKLCGETETAPGQETPVFTIRHPSRKER